MTPEEKQLLIKDLCARLPYGVMCHANEINLDGELLFINKVYNIVALYNDKASGEFDSCPIADIKPYLRPMSSMTEEEKREYSHTLVAMINNGGKSITFVYEEDFPLVMDWLNAHHFDYRGLVEKGLALEAPDGMYTKD